MMYRAMKKKLIHPSPLSANSCMQSIVKQIPADIKYTYPASEDFSISHRYKQQYRKCILICNDDEDNDDDVDDGNDEYIMLEVTIAMIIIY